MLEFNVLILTALTLFVVSLLILFYLVVTKSKEVERLKQVLHGTIKKVGLHDPDADLNNDGIIDIVDLVIIGVNFGKTW